MLFPHCYFFFFFIFMILKIWISLPFSLNYYFILLLFLQFPHLLLLFILSEFLSFPSSFSLKLSLLSHPLSHSLFHTLFKTDYQILVVHWSKGFDLCMLFTITFTITSQHSCSSVRKPSLWHLSSKTTSELHWKTLQQVRQALHITGSQKPCSPKLSPRLLAG